MGAYRLFLILGILGGALVVVLIIDFLTKLFVNQKVSVFLSNYEQLFIGMTKQEVINLLGNNYSRTVTSNSETLCWTCATNTAIQRELYSKREDAKTIIVKISKNLVTSFSLQ